MSDFRSPIADISFSLRHVADLDALAKLDGYEHADPELIDGLLEEAGRFFDEVVAPTNRDGDTVGTKLHDDGSITTAPGFADAYAKLVESGWNGIGFPEEYGGGGFPQLLSTAVQEMTTTANMAFALGPLLSQGAIEAIMHHGDETQREIYLQKLVTGEWTGTMNLTEPHAGSDVGALTSKAEPADDGTWRIFGQKIYITWGEHDIADNIVHLVLARTPGSPPGTKGISLFIVPKFLVNDDGSLGERNDLTCVSIEHKLGIHGSPTCVMQYGDNGGAVGYLLGEEHQGMRCMFTMMNNARLGVGVEGVGIAERAYQQALAYAHERTQGRAIGAEPGTESPIIDHPDVQRMLLDMKSTIAAMRGLTYRNAEALDHAHHGADEDARMKGEERAALLTPLSKSWCTDMGVELTSIGLQVHGGMGFIEETGAAQHFRDARIAPIYEGTNGIQAIDLAGRKLGLRQGGVVRDHLGEIADTIAALEGVDGLSLVKQHLAAALEALTAATDHLLAVSNAGPADMLAGAMAYLNMMAITTGGQILADGALAARSLGDAEAEDRAVLARFFAANRLAGVPGLLPAVTAGSADLAAARSRLLSS
jgi:alkylation response protein AidB-like acyl-CoA dehydrogenase